MMVLILMPKQTYSQTLSITETQRDSIYKKVQRGKINAERVRHLQGALASCDSASALTFKAVGLAELEIDNLQTALDIDKTIIKNLEENVKLEKKRGRRRAFWSFLRGNATGGGIVLILFILL